MGSSTVYNARLTCSFYDGVIPPMKSHRYIDVRVVVNPKTNNIITAYILDRQVDADPTLLESCGP
jgi:hypothetical protein